MTNLKSTNDSRKKTNQQNNQEILNLINSVQFFVQCAFILLKKNVFQLIVIKNNRLIMDKKYNTLRGAKIGFQKLFIENAWNQDIKATWSPPYTPGADWLNHKLRP